MMMKSQQSVLAVAVVVVLQIFVSAVIAIDWDHTIYINDDYRLLWSTKNNQDITFEIQVRTLGYIGFGFSHDGRSSGADVAIGWFDRGQAYFQDRHINDNGDDEPFVDPSQDYILLAGYENATHTVMRFKRKLDTCDTSHDIPITNDTMRIVYMYHESDPKGGSIAPGSLPNPQFAFKGYIPLSLTQRTHDEHKLNDITVAAPAAATTSYNGMTSSSSSSSSQTNRIQTMEIRNQDVKLPQGDDTVYWCNVFEIQEFKQKQHLIKFEPIFDSPRSKDFLQHIIMYECQGTSKKLEAMARENGRPCYHRNNPNVPCNAIIAAWTRGSEGFTFPPEAGYPLDSSKERFYLMETHYNNPQIPTDIESLHMGPVVDNSGIKLHYTSALRKHDAGVLSVGINPDWRHIIPPGHEKVISEGHCIDDCTRKTFPPQGISIFAVIMQTHNIGKEVKFRQIRKHEELLPIAYDGNVHAGYAEYRKISPPAKIIPGDRLIVECTYNSSSRESITLGGLTTREESCNVFAVYYPRQKKLSTCHSLPSLPTVLHSLGIDELAMDSNPLLIVSPPELAGMSLESRLVSYDWEHQFASFQRVTRTGSFRPICIDAKNNVVPGTDNIERFSPQLIKSWRSPIVSTCSNSRYQNDHHSMHDSKNIYVTEMATRRKNGAADTSEVESMSLSNASTTAMKSSLFIILLQLITYLCSIT